MPIARYKPRRNAKLLGYLKRTGRSGSWLAREAGVRPSTLFRIENGEHGAPGDWYQRLAGILACSLDDIAPDDLEAAA